MMVFPVVIFIGYNWLSEEYAKEFGVGPAYQIYSIPPKHQDDTLRVATIGDSWAEYHASLECDTIFRRYARHLNRVPLKCFSRGHSSKMTKEIYSDMFADRTVEHAWEKDYCTQPLIEQHPDYCIIMAGINDLRLYRPLSFYTGNYQLILRVLLQNGIRPVVMEMPDVDFKYALENRKFYEQWVFKMLSVVTDVDYRSAQDYRDAMRDMLESTGLKDSVLFIPVSCWNPGGVDANPEIYLDDRFHLNLKGYQKLDSCMATEIMKDFEKQKENK